VQFPTRWQEHRTFRHRRQKPPGVWDEPLDVRERVEQVEVELSVMLAQVDAERCQEEG